MIPVLLLSPCKYDEITRAQMLMASLAVTWSIHLNPIFVSSTLSALPFKSTLARHAYTRCTTCRLLLHTGTYQLLGISANRSSRATVIFLCNNKFAWHDVVWKPSCGESAVVSLIAGGIIRQTRQLTTDNMSCPC